MTSPTARVLALLEILQAGGTRTVPDLAARLAVDERTVRRYVGHLVELDIPVRSVRGRYGGYRLEPGYRLPPLMLTDDEALAVLLGLHADRAGTPAAASALAKIRRVLPIALGRRLDALLETAEFTAARRPLPDPGTDTLLLVAEAVRERRPVAMTYTAADGAVTARTIEPHGLVAHSGRWYVRGADSASGAGRTFRLDRITGARLVAGTFPAPEVDAADEVLAGLATVPYRHDVRLRVHGDAQDVRNAFPAGLVTVERAQDGWSAVRLRADRLDWVPRLLAGLDAEFVIDGPDELRTLVRDLASRLATSAARRDGVSGSS